MNAVDAVEQQLRHATRRRYRRHRSIGRRLTAAAVAVVVVAAVLVIAARNDERLPGDERPATRHDARSSATWTPVLGDDHRGHATISRDPVPPDELAALAILRRPPTAADRSPQVRALLRFLGSDAGTGVRVDAIRLLARHGDRVTVLVPIKRYGKPYRGLLRSTTVIVDALCVMSTLPDKVSGNPPPGAHLGGGVGGTCGILTDLVRRGIGWPGPPFGLVPDGVATVQLRVRGGKTVNAPVRNNVYDLTRQTNLFAIQPPRWLDKNGQRIHQP